MSLKAGQLWVVRTAEELSDLVFKSIQSWNGYARRTVGDQLVRAADSIGANLTEGYGRSHTADALRFYSIARGSLEETLYWLRRSRQKGLFDEKLCQQLIARYLLLSKSVDAFMKTQTPS